ncbi:MAG TPA: hypothetical protein VGL77_17805 [Armatimonadota bacterium]
MRQTVGALLPARQLVASLSFDMLVLPQARHQKAKAAGVSSDLLDMWQPVADELRNFFLISSGELLATIAAAKEL